MSRCACGHETVRMRAPEVFSRLPHYPLFEKCMACGFCWGVKDD